MIKIVLEICHFFAVRYFGQKDREDALKAEESAATEKLASAVRDCVQELKAVTLQMQLDNKESAEGRKKRKAKRIAFEVFKTLAILRAVHAEAHQARKRQSEPFKRVIAHWDHLRLLVSSGVWPGTILITSQNLDTILDDFFADSAGQKPMNLSQFEELEETDPKKWQMVAEAVKWFQYIMINWNKSSPEERRRRQTRARIIQFTLLDLLQRAGRPHPDQAWLAPRLRHQINEAARDELAQAESLEAAVKWYVLERGDTPSADAKPDLEPIPPGDDEAEAAADSTPAEPAM